jgi:alkylhydroperoxidase family enzyme
VATPIAVFSARMPTAFLTYYGKVSRLDKKLQLPSATRVLIRERVSTINGCAYCMDATRWYALRESPEDGVRLDALADYGTSPLFADAERAALDYVTDLVTDKHVQVATFERLARYFNEREICDIAWLVASEHLYNMTNIGLNIGSDGLCELPSSAGKAAGKRAVRSR